jgi:hypothetical protein
VLPVERGSIRDEDAWAPAVRRFVRDVDDGLCVLANAENVAERGRRPCQRIAWTGRDTRTRAVAAGLGAADGSSPLPTRRERPASRTGGGASRALRWMALRVTGFSCRR